MFPKIPGVTIPTANKQPLNSETVPAGQTVKSNEIVKPTQVILEWDAPERLFEKKSREFYRRLGVIIIFFALLLVVIQEFLLIAVLGGVYFAVYVFTTVPPRIVHHQLTTNGINYASEKLFRWNELRSFFIEKKQGINILNANTVDNLPGRIFLLLPEKIKPDEVIAIVNQYISIQEEKEENMYEKLNQQILKRFKM